MSKSNNPQLNDWHSSSIDSYIKEISKYEVLTHKKEKQIAKKITHGDEDSRVELIHGCLRFVITVAKRYAHLNIPFEDLINEGNTGLIKASKKFDPSKEIRFLTFAYHHINGEIISSIHNTSSQVRIPKYLTQKKLQKEKDLRLYDSLETLNENDLQLITELKNIKNWNNYFPKYVDLENEAFNIAHEDPITFNIKNDKNRSVDLKAILINAFADLPKNERYVIELYFGINPENKRETFQSISDKMGLSKEGVRVIQLRALKKLKKILKNIDLDDFKDN